MLNPGVIDGIVHKGDSVCGTRNKAGFDKLYGALN